MVREEKEYNVVELIHRRRLSHGDGSLGQAILLRSAVSAQWLSAGDGRPITAHLVPRTGDGTNHPRSSSVQPTPGHPHRLTPTQATTHPLQWFTGP